MLKESLCFLILLQLLGIHNVFSYLEQCESKHGKYQRSRAECSRLDSYHPWDKQDEDESCKDYVVKLSDTPLPPTALTSLCMSGNHYLLQLVELSSGIMAWDFFPPVVDSSTRSKVACGIKLGDGKTILQSGFDTMHDFMPSWQKPVLHKMGEERDWPTLSVTHFNYRGILLVRNPWFTIPEMRRRLQTYFRKCNTCPSQLRSLREINDYQGKDFENFVSFAARRWVDMLRTWINNSPFGSDMVIIKYEDLIKNPEPELRRVLNFLNVTVDEGRLRCALNDHFYTDTVSNLRDMDVLQNVFETRGVNQLLEVGINEINQMLATKGIATRLDYVAPNWEIVARSAPLGTRKLHPF